MKKIVLLLVFQLLYGSFSFASHTYGGEISWHCMPNGKYQFLMTFYRDCTGIPWFFQDESIEIVGSPLPTDGNGTTVNSILMRPDSARWLAANQGNFTFSCTDQYGLPLKCSDGGPKANGLVQSFFYKSDPIILSGVPPTSGWHFFREHFCCRPGNMGNVFTNGANPRVLLRAIMYPTKNRDKINPCLYSSAEFANPPSALICRGKNTYINYSLNAEGDSLSYAWDSPIDPPIAAPVPLSYKPGYSFTNPTPDQAFDTRNTPSQLDGRTGMVELGIYSGTGVEKFLNVIRVDTWREGKKLSSVYRELPLSVLDCAVLFTRKENKPPQFRINNVIQNNIILDANVGDKISIPIEVIDNDSNGVGNNKQLLTLTPLGQNFSADYVDTLACPFPPCAVLKNSKPTYDNIAKAYLIKDSTKISTTFQWQTDCGMLGNKPWQIFNFYFQAQDDHCPVPQIVNGTISIRLFQDYSIIKPAMNCVFEENGFNNVSWDIADPVTSWDFEKWFIYGSPNSVTDTFILLDSSSVFENKSFVDSSNINKQYVVNAKYLVCGEPYISNLSDTITTEEISDTLGIRVINNGIELNWLSRKSSFSNIDKQKYYIYREAPIGSGFQLLDSVRNTIQYFDSTPYCDEEIAYYVEHDSILNNCSYKSRIASIYQPGVEIEDSIYIRKRTSNFERVALVALEDKEVSYQWYDCIAKKIIPNATEREFFPKEKGVYAVILTGLIRCIDTSECIVYDPVGIEEIPFQERLAIYPNPTTGEIKVTSQGTSQKLHIQVRNIHGQLVQEQQFINQKQLEINIQGKAGIYFLQLSNEKGERANLKVVKQ